MINNIEQKRTRGQTAPETNVSRESQSANAQPVRQFPPNSQHYVQGASDRLPDATKKKFKSLLNHYDSKAVKRFLDKLFQGAQESYESNDRKVNQLREVANEFDVDEVHDMLDGYGTQIGVEGLDFYAPGLSASAYQRETDKAHPRPDVVHRDIMETERIGNENYVPVYTAIVSSVIDEKNGNPPKYKDFEQDPVTGQIIIHTGDSNTLWVSFGQAIRQLVWILKYRKENELELKATEEKLGEKRAELDQQRREQDAERAEPGATEEAFPDLEKEISDLEKEQDRLRGVTPLIRSFMLPLHVANKIQKTLVTERNVKDAEEQDGDLDWSKASLNVDKEYGGNQLGIRSAEVMNELRIHALRKSLRTYAPTAAQGQGHSNWGRVLSLETLQNKYGFPTKELSGEYEFIQTVQRLVPTKVQGVVQKEKKEVARFPKKKKVRELAEHLSNIHDIHRRLMRSAPEQQVTSEEKDQYDEFVHGQNEFVSAEMDTVDPNSEAVQHLMQQVERSANRAAIFQALAENYQAYLWSDQTVEPVFVAIRQRPNERMIGRKLSGHEPLDKKQVDIFKLMHKIDMNAKALEDEKKKREQSLSKKERDEIEKLLKHQYRWEEVKKRTNYEWTTRNLNFIDGKEDDIKRLHNEIKQKLTVLKRDGM